MSRALARQITAEPADAALRCAMAQFLMSYGFTALRQTVTRIEGELSKEHRELLALQGWIA